jgi:DNA polymerase-3 subunit alpha
VWDFIQFAKKHGIPVGPGRGSAAGSMVSYCLEITELDSMKYNLLFERFLNPERNEMPDMDIDFCALRRDEVIEYVKQKYGEDHVSQIITFNKMKSKGAIRDVARALEIPLQQVNALTKLIRHEDLEEALQASDELKQLYKTNDTGKQLIDIAKKVEGLTRSAGKHAAGVVISREPLMEHVPLYKDPKDGSISSQYEKESLEKAGLVKMDFLGLANLTIIDTCIKLIKKHKNITIDIAAIPLDDAKTFKLLQKADTMGVFQLESSGMQNILLKLGPTNFDDIIAIVALYRPGPLDSGMVEEFIELKRNP